MPKNMLVLAVTVLGLLSAPSWSQAGGPLPVVNGIRVFKAADRIGVEISADKAVEFSSAKMPQLLKVIVDLPRTELGNLPHAYRYKSVIVSDIRLDNKTINDVLLTRVVINLNEDADFKVEPDAEHRKVTVFLTKPAPGSGSAAAPSENPAPLRLDSGTSPAAAVPARQVSAAAVPARHVSDAAVPARHAPVAPVAKSAARSAGNQPVTVTDVNWGADSIEIQSGSGIGDFKAFTLKSPGRLVVDIPAARTTLRGIPVKTNRFGISTARVGLFEGKLRLVFDTGATPFPGYQVVKTGTGLRVVLRGSTDR